MNTFTEWLNEGGHEWSPQQVEAAQVGWNAAMDQLPATLHQLNAARPCGRCGWFFPGAIGCSNKNMSHLNVLPTDAFGCEFWERKP